MKTYSWIIALPLLFLFSASRPAEENTSINWVSIEEAARLADEDGKKILIDLYTDWCGWCKKMDRDTYAKKAVAAYINEHYHAVKFDAEQKEKIEIKGRIYTFKDVGRRGVHELALRLTNGRPSYPTTAILDSDFSRLTAIPGYKKPGQLMPILSFFGEDAYKSTSWSEFERNYSSNW